MNKDKFIKSALILIIGGFITKILGMFIRILNTRILGIYGITLYMLVIPTYNLFTSISTFSLPNTISKLIGEEKHSSKLILLSSTLITLLLNILLIIILIISSKYIACNLLKNSKLYLPILSIILILPFESISNIIKGYFFGKENMIPLVISNIIEQLIRIVITILILPKIYEHNYIYGITFLLLINIFTNIFSLITLFIFLPKEINIRKYDYPNKPILKKILNISIPNTSNKIFQSIILFLEPIIIISLDKDIIPTYGIVIGLIIPLILLPSFFMNAISSSLLPIISKDSIDHNYRSIKKKVNKAFKLSLLIIGSITIILFLFPDKIMNIIYKTNTHYNYVRILLIPFLINYLDIILEVLMQALNKAKLDFFIDSISSIIRLIILIILLILKYGIYSYIISLSIEIILVFILHLINIKR